MTDFIHRTLYPRNRLAAVLVLLYEDEGALRVLLTTRSKTLRTHAGQTALPGGRVDEGDKTLVETAVGNACLLNANRVILNHIIPFSKLREAYEEVRLPLGSVDIHVLGAHEPFLSLHKLVVTPVFALLTRKNLLGELKPSEAEVSRIFSHPLEAILDPQLSQHEADLAALGSEDWPYQTTYHVSLHAIFGF